MECARRWERLLSIKSMSRGLFQQQNQGGELTLYHMAGGWISQEPLPHYVPRVPTWNLKSLSLHARIKSLCLIKFYISGS